MVFGDGMENEKKNQMVEPDYDDAYCDKCGVWLNGIKRSYNRQICRDCLPEPDENKDYNSLENQMIRERERAGIFKDDVKMKNQQLVYALGDIRNSSEVLKSMIFDERLTVQRVTALMILRIRAVMRECEDLILHDSEVN